MTHVSLSCKNTSKYATGYDLTITIPEFTEVIFIKLRFTKIQSFEKRTKTYKI